MVLRLCRMGDRRQAAVRELESRCMEADHTVHRMYLKSDCNLDPFMKCFYIREMKGSPKSVLSISNMEDGRAEITAFTDPEYRRRGMFLELFGEAADMLRERGFDRVYFVHEPASKDGKKVLDRLGARYEKSEYMMEKRLDGNVGADSRRSGKDGIPAEGGIQAGAEILIAEAGPDDLERLTGLLADCFSMDPEYARERLREESGGSATEGGPEYSLWKACVKEELAGMCAVCREKETASLFDVCVRREDRRKGIGSALVRGVLDELTAAGIRRVRLQTGSERAAAVRLYRSLGFEETDRLDYYELFIDRSGPSAPPLCAPQDRSDIPSAPF